uniref:Uncharacterized protein n=1 Tax=Anguilla anguilla TaxID=7936 RepID=A0A0E9P6B6_ANGAN
MYNDLVTTGISFFVFCWETLTIKCVYICKM